MKFYHYTSCDHLQNILATGEIRLTASNLLKPKNPHIVNGNVIDETDSYKPVVWLTTIMDFDKANMCGLNGGTADKTEAFIEIDPPPFLNICKWDIWAKKNNIDMAWFEALKRTAPLWNTFYICESPIKITDDNCSICFRQDICQELQKGGQSGNNSNS